MDLERGAHDCHLYRSWSEQSSVVLPFIHAGLANGEHCILVTNAKSFDRWRRELRAFDVDVAREERRGAFQFITGEAWRIPAANSIILVRRTLEFVNPLLVEFNGVRIVGDVEWDLDPAVPADRLCHWEATANLVFEGSDVRAICQYDVNHYAAAMLHGALRTHRSVIWDGRRHQNPDYEAPQILEHEPHLNGSTADRDTVDGMLLRLGERSVGRTALQPAHNGHMPALN